MKKNLRSNELQKAKQVSGNVLTELNEAELGSIVNGRMVLSTFS